MTMCADRCRKQTEISSHRGKVFPVGETGSLASVGARADALSRFSAASAEKSPWGHDDLDGMHVAKFVSASKEGLSR